MGQMVEFRANGASAQGYLAVPASGRGPGLIVIQEWWGLVDHIKQVCDRFAEAGFVALAPDHYHGRQTKSPDDAGKLFMALNITQAGKELRGAAEYLLANKAVDPKRVGTLGFCMGGQLALFAAAEHGDRVACAVDFYGIHPNVKIDPARLKVPVLGHFGTRDHSVPVEGVRQLAAEVGAAGGSFETHFYEADHAFFNDTRPQAYNRAAAELAWQRTIEFLGKHLGSGEK
jgi:carboxymethylenebutenolidase